MPKILGYIAAIIGGAALYAFGYKLVEVIFDHIKEKGLSLRRKDKINLSGTWYAAGRQQLKVERI